jgi:hypothetical protein
MKKIGVSMANYCLGRDQEVASEACPNSWGFPLKY